uniref:Si:ch211-227m13.1 n=1 Tax=Sinocyclocheilus grahami TaxID=75366 RepID=A0A672PC22_SINGR
MILFIELPLRSVLPPLKIQHGVFSSAACETLTKTAVVMILLIMIVVIRFMAHQKGTYYTHEETLAFKSDPEVQEVTEDLEDPEEEYFISTYY